MRTNLYWYIGNLRVFNNNNNNLYLLQPNRELYIFSIANEKKRWNCYIELCIMITKMSSIEAKLIYLFVLAPTQWWQVTVAKKKKYKISK